MSPRVADVWKPTRQLAGAVGRCGSPDQVVGRVAELWRVRVETGREVRIAVVVFQELEQQSNRRRGPSRVAVPASAVRSHQPAPIRAACKDSLSSQAAFLSSEHAAVARVDIALLHCPDAVTTSRAEQPEYLVGPAPVVTGLVESPEPHDLDRVARRPERLRRTRWNYRPSSCDAEDGSLALSPRGGSAPAGTAITDNTAGSAPITSTAHQVGTLPWPIYERPGTPGGACRLTAERGGPCRDGWKGSNPLPAQNPCKSAYFLPRGHGLDTFWTRFPQAFTRIGAGGYTICRKAILESVSSRSEDDDVAVGVVNPSDPFAPRLVGGFLDDGCAALAQKLDGCVAVVHVHP
jgi:hypothetical protein